jgi:hypothetical protein
MAQRGPLDPSVLVVTGVGVGKSAVPHETDALVVEVGDSHATVEMEEIARCSTAATETPTPS